MKVSRSKRFFMLYWAFVVILIGTALMVVSEPVNVSATEKSYDFIVRSYIEKASSISISGMNLSTDQLPTREEINQLLHQVQINMGERYLKKKYSGKNCVSLETLQKSFGNKYTLQVDASYTAMAVDSPLCILPLNGLEIKNLLEAVVTSNLEELEDGRDTEDEDDMKERYEAIEKTSTGILSLFYGIEYSCDITKPEGFRVKVLRFTDGKEFEWVPTYNLVLPECYLGSGIFEQYCLEQTVWSQTEDQGGGSVWELVLAYLKLKE